MDQTDKKIVNKEEVKAKKRIMVVKEIPTQQVRSFVEDGVEYEVITIEEALTQLLNN